MFLALLLPYVLSNFYRAFLAVVSGSLSRDLGVDAAGLASLQAAFLWAFALAQIPVGLALDQFGPRRTLSWGLAAALAGSLLLAVSTGFWAAVAAMVLLGTGFAPVLMAGFYVIARVHPPARFATLSSLLFGLGSLGDPLSGAPLAFAVGAFGWRPTMLGMAGLTAASLVAAAAVVRDPPRVAAPGRPPAPLAGVREIAGLRMLWPIVPIALTGYAVVAATRGLWIGPYLAEVHGFGPGAVSLAATAMGFASAAGALLYAPLNRWLGDAKITAASGVAVTVAVWLALGLLGDRSGALAVGLLLLAAGFGASFAILLAHVRAFLPDHLIGQGVTLTNLVVFFGAGLAQWLSGRFVRAADLAAWPPAEIYGRLFTAFGLVLAVSLAIYLRAPRERPRRVKRALDGGSAG